MSSITEFSYELCCILGESIQTVLLKYTVILHIKTSDKRFNI